MSMPPTSSDIVVHLTHATDGLETDDLDVAASERRYHSLVQRELMRAFAPRSVELHMFMQCAPALSILRCPADVSGDDIEAVIERIWLRGEWRVLASAGETLTRETPAIHGIHARERDSGPLGALTRCGAVAPETAPNHQSQVPAHLQPGEYARLE